MTGIFAIVNKGKEDCLPDLLKGTESLMRGGHNRGFAITNGDAVRIRKHSTLSKRIDGTAGTYDFAGIGVVSPERYPAKLAPELDRCAFVLDGRVVNYGSMRKRLEFEGHKFDTNDHDELMATTVATKPDDIGKGIRRALDRAAGHCNLFALLPNELYAACGLHGIKTFAVGEKVGAWAVSTDSSALCEAGCDHVCDVEPGQIIRISAKGVETVSMPKMAHRVMRCFNQWTRIANSNSVIAGVSVRDVRTIIGTSLARLDEAENFVFPRKTTVIGSEPYSTGDYVKGYSQESGIKLAKLFDVPSSTSRPRHYGNFKPIEENLGKIVILMVTSVSSDLAGTVKLLYDFGASQVHIRVVSPKLTGACPFDFPLGEELDIAVLSDESIRHIVGADSVRFLTPQQIMEAIKLPPNELCFGCVSVR